jgi:hypothetical protein
MSSYGTRIAPSKNLTERGSSRAMGDATFASPWRSHRECASRLGVCAGYPVPGPEEQTILDAVLSRDREHAIRYSTAVAAVAEPAAATTPGHGTPDAGDQPTAEGSPAGPARPPPPASAAWSDHLGETLTRPLPREEKGRPRGEHGDGRAAVGGSPHYLPRSRLLRSRQGRPHRFQNAYQPASGFGQRRPAMAIVINPIRAAPNGAAHFHVSTPYSRRTSWRPAGIGRPSNA